MNRYDIAIVGMGCVFPKANSVDEYWKNIVSGETYFEEMPERIWRMKNFYSADKLQPDKSYTMTGAFVSDFEFPFLEFKLPPNAMKGVDPAQLVTLHAARQALEDAGIAPHSSELDEAVTVIGASGVDQFAHSTMFLRRHMYLKRLRPQLEQAGVSPERLAELDEQFANKLNEYGHVWNPSVAAVGAITSSLSNRVAQVLGVRGFNMTVDGACASSFVALEVACQALMAGDARVALAGGTDLGTNPAIYIGFSRVDGLSKKGMSNPFDNSADGLVIGEGGGVVVLKRLEDALADGDRIRAVIRGAGSSSDGAGQAIYAPSVEGRAIALRSALERSGTSVDEVQFLEAHATSTVVGDANEYDAISSVYGGRSADNPLYLGSVKHQIGHLKAAAGIAGLIKTVLAMENETVPHMPRFETLTRGATMPSPALVVNKDLMPWKVDKEGKRVAAVTSSGFGGVNFHFIVEQGDKYAPPAARPKVPRDIAVVGLTCRVPGAETPETFWENIKKGVDVFSDVNPEELRWEDHLDTGPANERIYTKRVARLDDYKFNVLRHKIFPKSMDQIAPTQFLGLDLADRLLEEAGFELQEKKNVGVSIGAMHDDYFPEIFIPMALDEYAEAIRACEVARSLEGDVLEKALAKVHEDIKKTFPPVTEHTLPGWMTNVIAGRMANKLNLQGPNFTVDSACSSGVGAFLPAMYQLMYGTVDMMISGGLNQQLSDTFTSGVCSIDAMAERVARPFDAAGKGFLVGEGGVLYLLKRLADAERDGDEILAIIHGVGGSSEADSKSMLAPTEESVRRSIRTGLALTDFRPEEIGVVDCHGSANLLSDLVEARSLAAELRGGGGVPPVHLTAIKSHVGHLYGGAGASSLFSTIYALRDRTVPGIRNMDTPRPEIEDILDKARPRHGTEPLEDVFTAGAVNSLGLGGANYFLVVSTPTSRSREKSTEPKHAATETEAAVSNNAGGSSVMSVARPMMRAGDQSSTDIFVCLAQSESELESAIGRALKQSPIPQFISEGSDPDTRLAVTYTSEDELKSKLGNALRMLQGGHSLRPLESQGVYTETVTPDVSPEPLVFCFPGQGTHYIGMGRFLYDSHDGFRETVDVVHELALKTFDFDLRGHIYGDPGDKAIAERLGSLVGAQTALFAIEVGMARVLESLGVRPDVAVGHSFGEISALAVAGVWDLATAYRVVEARIRSADIVLQGDGPRLGMMSVICSDEQRDAILGLSEGKVVLTNVNAPGRFILSGELDWVKRTVAVAESFGAEARLLPIGAAFHSRYMDPARGPYRQALSELPCAQPAFPILSTITGEYIKPGMVTSEWLAEHLSSQLVTKLDLPRDVGRLYNEGHRHFLEVGPGWSVTKMVAAIIGEKPYRAAPVLHPKVGDEETFRRARAFLVALGHMGSAAERQNLPRLFSDDFVSYLEDREPAVLALIEEVHSRYLDITKREAHKMFGRPSAPRPAEGRTSKATVPARPAFEIPAPVEAKPAPAEKMAAPAPAPAVAVADIGVWVERVRKKLVTTTGYPPEMLEDDLDLEADLGVDSVQRAEIWISLTEEYGLDKEARPTGIRTIANFAEALASLDNPAAQAPASPATSAPAVAPAPASVPAPAPAGVTTDTGAWVERVREKLVTTTGYPPEMLEDDLDLEADLGVDSVQRAEIWISLTEEYGLDKEARPTGIRTIANFAEALARLDNSVLEAPAPVTSVPKAAPSSSVSPPAQPAAQPAAQSFGDTGAWVERVREKLVTTTGYPPEMLEDDLDLEADLGVDSVQRAEIWISLTEEYGLDKEARPTGIRTIANFAEALAKLDGSSRGSKEVETPATSLKDVAQVGQAASEETWELFATTTAAVTGAEMKPFHCRRVVVVAERRDRWTAGLANRLTKHGVETEVLEAYSVDDTFPEALAKLIGGCDTIIYAAHKEIIEAKQTGREALAALRDETDRLYTVFKKLFGVLEKDPKRIIVPVSQDGAFGALEGRPQRLLGSFPAGFVKSLARELTECKVQLVDTGDMGWPEAIEQVIDKTTDFVELGLTSFGPVRPLLARVSGSGDGAIPLEKDDLVVVTGGARGIVFECVAALAQKTGCRLLLTGRTRMPEGKPAWLDAAASEIDGAVRDLEIELVKSKKMPLGEAKKEGAKARSQWELTRNLSRLDEAGVQARYEVCDVSNPDDLGRLLRATAEKEVIKGVVHGAGVQRSKLLPELTEEAVYRTMDTKTTPVLAMLDNLDWSQIKVLAGFGSITGVFGNPGQTDYAMANDLLAWMVASLGAKHPGLKAQTIDWTAWSGTGMVTDEEAKRFEQAGLIPVDIESGVGLFLRGLTSARQTRLAAFNPKAAFASGRELSSHAIAATPRQSLLEENAQDGRAIARFVKSRDLFLEQHLVNGDPVAPGTFVSEIFAEASRHRAEALCDINFRRPLWVRDEIFDVEVIESSGALTLLPAERPQLNEKGLANLAFATARLGEFEAGEAEKLKYSKKDLEALLEAAGDDASSFYTLLDSTYSHALATGPIFRGIRATVERGGRYFGSVAMTPEARSMVDASGRFAFDPVLADMAVQVGCAWGMQTKAVMAIPFEIGCLRVHGEMSGTEAVVICKAHTLDEEKAVLDVAVRDLAGNLVLTMDKLVLKTIARADDEN